MQGVYNRPHFGAKTNLIKPQTAETVMKSLDEGFKKGFNPILNRSNGNIPAYKKISGTFQDSFIKNTNK